MSCGELERLFVAGATREQALAHRSACRSCGDLGADMDRIETLVSGLRTPSASPVLREALLSIPHRTVSCEGADVLVAPALEEELEPADRQRLDFHLSRCEPCRETAATLAAMRGLTAPSPAPWLAGRLASSKPARRRRAVPLWDLVLSPKGAIGLAYAAAVIVMLAGFNPADIARRAGVARLGETAKASVEVASGSLADRVGAFQDSALRKLAVWRGQVAGYGRAALSTALALVMKSDQQRPPSRPRSGEERKRMWQNETAIDLARLGGASEEGAHS
jgi:hypothetical protein